jgi:hypothetical protein
MLRHADQSGRYLVEYCSPTLASLKMASLFRYRCEKSADLDQLIAEWEEALGGKGIRVLVLHRCDTFALIYVFRESRLKNLLKDVEVRAFLRSCGYRSFEPEQVIAKLKKHLWKKGDFPHEIGIFLGYPLGDVIGFIKNEGRNYKMIGNWKVYCNEEESMRAFERYRKCRDVYTRLWRQGRSVAQLTVAG